MPYESQAYCFTNRRPTSVQMGVELQGFPSSRHRSQEGTVIRGGVTSVQSGGLLQWHKLLNSVRAGAPNIVSHSLDKVEKQKTKKVLRVTV